MQKESLEIRGWLGIGVFGPGVYIGDG